MSPQLANAPQSPCSTTASDGLEPKSPQQVLADLSPGELARLRELFRGPKWRAERPWHVPNAKECESFERGFVAKQS